MLTVGVLALQGAFAEHIIILNKIEGIHAIPVKTVEQLEKCQALILPGGESTSIVLSAQRINLIQHIQEFIKSNKPVWGVCAGMILLSERAEKTKEGGQMLFGGLDVVVKRNAFGSQIDSFTAAVNITGFKDAFPGVFIRAPVIEKIGDKVEILAMLQDGRIVAVKQKNILATSFHPEFTGDQRFHHYFLSLIK
jgi:5'-phosphate synthase pdxT subunit